jgi:Na+-transporting NADH:ubiquinone oxidoreductase subunit NqrE
LTGLGVASLLVLVLIVPLTLLSRALCLIVVVPTLVSGAELRTLGIVLLGVSAGLPWVLSFVVEQFFPFVFKANFLVQQSLEIGEIVAL